MWVCEQLVGLRDEKASEAHDSAAHDQKRVGTFLSPEASTPLPEQQQQAAFSKLRTASESHIQTQRKLLREKENELAQRSEQAMDGSAKLAQAKTTLKSSTSDLKHTQKTCRQLQNRMANSVDEATTAKRVRESGRNFARGRAEQRWKGEPACERAPHPPLQTPRPPSCNKDPNPLQRARTPREQLQADNENDRGRNSRG